MIYDTPNSRRDPFNPAIRRDPKALAPDIVNTRAVFVDGKITDPLKSGDIVRINGVNKTTSPYGRVLGFDTDNGRWVIEPFAVMGTRRQRRAYAKVYGNTRPVTLTRKTEEEQS